jgi:hypothetical protein
VPLNRAARRVRTGVIRRLPDSVIYAGIVTTADSTSIWVFADTLTEED